jgi:hypothetical protein
VLRPGGVGEPLVLRRGGDLVGSTKDAHAVTSEPCRLPRQGPRAGVGGDQSPHDPSRCGQGDRFAGLHRGECVGFALRCRIVRRAPAGVRLAPGRPGCCRLHAYTPCDLCHSMGVTVTTDADPVRSPGRGFVSGCWSRTDATVLVQSAGRARPGSPSRRRGSWGPVRARGCRRCRGLRRPSKRLTSTARMLAGGRRRPRISARVRPRLSPTDRAWVRDGTERRANASVGRAL